MVKGKSRKMSSRTYNKYYAKRGKGYLSYCLYYYKSDDCIITEHKASLLGKIVLIVLYPFVFIINFIAYGISGMSDLNSAFIPTIKGKPFSQDASYPRHEKYWKEAVDHIESGIVQVDYTYLEGDEEYPYCVADLDYFMKEYIRMPYSANEGEIMNNKVHFEGAPDWVVSGAVDKDGSLYWYNAYACQLVINECLEEHGVNAYVEDLPNHPDCLDKYMFVGLGYNTDDWRNSAVDRGCEDY